MVAITITPLAIARRSALARPLFAAAQLAGTPPAGSVAVAPFALAGLIRPHVADDGLRLAFAPIARCVDFGPRTAPVRDALVDLLAGWTQMAATPDARSFASVRERDGRFVLRSRWLDRPSDHADPLVAAGHLAVDLGEEWQADRPDALSLHCAALLIDGRLVLCPGEARSGKSLFAAAAAAAGHTIFTDDALALTGEGDRLGQSLGIALRLRRPLPDTLSPFLHGFVAAKTIRADARYAYLGLPEGLGPRYGETAPIGAVVLLDRCESGAADLTRSARGTPLEHLLLASLSADVPDASAMQRLAPVLADVPCYRLRYARVEDGVAALSRIDWAAPATGATEVAMPRDRSVHSGTRYRASKTVVVASLEDRAFVGVAGEDFPVRLDGVALGVWNLLAQPTAIDEAIEIVAGAFPDEPPAQIAADVRALFADLESRRLIETV